MSIILDLFICTCTSYNTLFFLNILNQKNIYYIILTGLILDFIIANYLFLITLSLIVLFYLNKYILNYYFKNIFNYLIMLMILRFKFNLINIFLQILFIYLNRKHIIKW